MKNNLKLKDVINSGLLNDTTEIYLKKGDRLIKSFKKDVRLEKHMDEAVDYVWISTWNNTVRVTLVSNHVERYSDDL